MQTMKMLTTAAAVAAVLVSAGTAMAAPVTPGPVATMVPMPQRNQHNQFQSNQNLRVARRHVELAIDELHRDPADYGGHKEKAVDDLTQARAYLEQGLSYQRTHGRTNGTPVPTTGGVLPRPVTGSDNENTETRGSDVGENEAGNGNGMIRGQGAGNENIVDVRRHVETAIDALGRDSWDYGGFKERAMDRLQAARAELEAALDFVKSPGVRNGGHGASDANLRYVSTEVSTTINRLETDRNDYGGHRVAAINDLNAARNYLGAALSYDTSHDNFNGAAAAGTVLPGTLPAAGNRVTQGASNDSLLDARQHLENAIDALQRDSHDYGGNRVKAIDALNAARTELMQAIDFRRSH